MSRQEGPQFEVDWVDDGAIQMCAVEQLPVTISQINGSEMTDGLPESSSGTNLKIARKKEKTVGVGRPAKTAFLVSPI